MADATEYEFKILQNPTSGEKQFLYTNTITGKKIQLPDQATYDKFKAKFNTAAESAYSKSAAQQDKEFEKATSASSDLDSFANSVRSKNNMKPFGKAKGGKVSSASKRADGCVKAKQEVGLFKWLNTNMKHHMTE
jgi:acyl-CoA reductase-like NAD-dependent aldehyde dehydrogenase